MSKNILQLLFDLVWDCGVSGCKMISKTFGLNWNEYDFRKFFDAVSLKNSQGISPKLKGKSNEGVYRTYLFDVPIGLSINDFNSKISPLSFFMKTKEEDLTFEVTEDLQDVKLKVLCFNDFFRSYKLKDSKDKYPKLIEKIEEDLFQYYIFELPKYMEIDEFKAKFDKIYDYLKIEENRFKYEITIVEDSDSIKVSVYK